MPLTNSQGNYLRVRGEYWLFDGLDYNPKELPPRARRIHAYGKCASKPWGTTSACAENTRIRFPV